MDVGEGVILASLHVVGASTRTECPPEPPPMVYVDERTPLGQDTVAIEIPAEMLVPEPGYLALDERWVGAQVDLDYVGGRTHLPMATVPEITGPMPGTLTVARTRRRFDEEDGMGGVWCTTVEEVQVTVTLDGTPAVWTFSASEDNGRVQVDGRCS